MDWEFVKFSDIDDQMLRRWQAIIDHHLKGNPALDSRFIGLALQYFGTGNELLAFGKVDNQDMVGAVLKPLAYGQWTLFQPGQMCLSPIIHARDINLAGVLKSLIKSLPGYCLRLSMPKIDPMLQDMDNLFRDLPADLATYGETYLIDLDGDFDAYWRDRNRNLRHNSRRWFRKIEQLAVSTELKCLRGAESMEQAVAIHAALESSGWKGEHGSAISFANRQGQFYTELLTLFAKNNDALTFQLYFDNRPVASLLAIVSGGIIVVLKTAHSEMHRDLAPGRTIDYLVLQQSFSNHQYSIMDMYTRASRSDLAWATRSRTMYVADAYRSPIVKLAIKGLRIIRRMSNRHSSPVAAESAN